MEKMDTSSDMLSPTRPDPPVEMLAEGRFLQSSAKPSPTDPAAQEVEGATDDSAARPAAIVTARGDAAAPHDPQQATYAVEQSSVLDALLKASPLPQLAGAAPGAPTAAHPPLTGPRDGAAPLRGAPPPSASCIQGTGFGQYSATLAALLKDDPTSLAASNTVLTGLLAGATAPADPAGPTDAPQLRLADRPAGPGSVQSSATCTAALHNAQPAPPPAAATYHQTTRTGLVTGGARLREPPSINAD